MPAPHEMRDETAAPSASRLLVDKIFTRLRLEASVWPDPAGRRAILGVVRKLEREEARARGELVGERLIASAIRMVGEGARTRAAGVESGEDRESFYRVADLAIVLARLLEGQTLYRSMGAPGDWGYESAIGAAYFKALEADTLYELTLRPPGDVDAAVVGPTP